MHPGTIILLVLGFISLNAVSQQDSVMYIPGSRLEDGIYLSYSDFRRNNGIKKAQIISNLDKEQQEFMSKVLSEDKLTFDENGKAISVESKSVWGYMQNNTLYVNFRGDFYRVPVFGSVSYFVATVLVVNPGFYDPRFGISTGGGTTRELREFVMNFYDGIIVEFSPEAIEHLLERDKALFEEYKKLGRRKQKEQIYGYIRKYNAVHPVYFLR